MNPLEGTCGRPPDSAMRSIPPPKRLAGRGMVDVRILPLRARRACRRSPQNLLDRWKASCHRYGKGHESGGLGIHSTTHRRQVPQESLCHERCGANVVRGSGTEIQLNTDIPTSPHDLKLTCLVQKSDDVPSSTLSCVEGRAGQPPRHLPDALSRNLLDARRVQRPLP